MTTFDSVDDGWGPFSAAGPGQARTRRARAAVVAAAQRNFLDEGYVATTIADISQAAGVPVATVYRLFSTKLGILRAVLDVAIAGDDEDIPIAARPPVQAAFDDPEPRGRIAGFVGVTTSINRRISAIYRTLVNAADADHEAATFLDELNAQRQRGQGLLASSFASSGSLSPSVSEQDAADIIHTLMSPEVYRLLVHDRGWAPEQYASWVTDTLIAQLLPDDTSSTLARDDRDTTHASTLHRPSGTAR